MSGGDFPAGYLLSGASGEEERVFNPSHRVSLISVSCTIPRIRAFLTSPVYQS